MAHAEDHLAELLRLPLSERAKAARALIYSFDEDGDGDEGAELAQAAELMRRLDALDSGEAQLIDADEARDRIAARLRSVRGR